MVDQPKAKLLRQTTTSDRAIQEMERRGREEERELEEEQLILDQNYSNKIYIHITGWIFYMTTSI